MPGLPAVPGMQQHPLSGLQEDGPPGECIRIGPVFYLWAVYGMEKG